MFRADYVTSAPLILSNNSILIGCGTNNGSISTTSSTTIRPTGNFPAFTDAPGAFSTINIQGIIIYYDNKVPTDTPSNNAKIGFKFTQSGRWPQRSNFSDIIVIGALYAYYDTTGTYLTKLSTFFAWNCLYGFRKENGTTVIFERCNTWGGTRAFYFNSVIALTCISCGTDQLNCTHTIYGGITFTGVTGLSLLGWDNEGAIIQPNSSLFVFINTTGTISGLSGVGNTIKTSENGNTSYIKCLTSCYLQFTGCRSGNHQSDLAVSGSGGSVYTMACDKANNLIKLSSSCMLAPSGGSPIVRYSLVATGASVIDYEDTRFDNFAVGAYQMVEREEKIFAPVPSGLAKTGSPIYRGTCTRIGNLVWWHITIDPNGGTTASTAGGTRFTGLPFSSNGTRGVFGVVDSANKSLGNGVVAPGSIVYPPAWSASSAVVYMSGVFQIDQDLSSKS